MLILDHHQGVPATRYESLVRLTNFQISGRSIDKQNCVFNFLGGYDEYGPRGLAWAFASFAIRIRDYNLVFVIGLLNQYFERLVYTTLGIKKRRELAEPPGTVAFSSMASRSILALHTLVHIPILYHSPCDLGPGYQRRVHMDINARLEKLERENRG